MRILSSALASPFGTVLALTLFLSHCAVAKYPGQPGVRTNGFSQIEREFIDVDGLWTFEVVYDNSEGGPGHIATITKLYPEAKTFTSNARSNGHGSFYRHKYPYRGAEIQAIYLAKTDQMIIPAGSKVITIVDAKLSVNEIDDRNINEEGIFTDWPQMPKAVDLSGVKADLAMLRAGTLTAAGTLGYNLAALALGKQKFSFAKPVYVEASLYQQGLATSLSRADKAALLSWFNGSFPTGYEGDVTFELSSGKTFTRAVKLNTFATLKNTKTSVRVSDDMYAVYESVLNYAADSTKPFPHSPKP